MAGVGAAAVCFPSLAASVARAVPAVRLVPRWEHSRSALEVRLHVRSADGAAVELLAHALDVTAELRAGEDVHALSLASQGLLDQRISRSGARLERRLVVPARREVRYDVFRGSWPEGFAGAGTLALRTHLRRNAMPDADRAGLASLVGLRLEVLVTRPA